MSEARAIYQEHLDTVTEALWKGDFEKAADFILLPGRVDFLDQKVDFLTRASVVTHFSELRRVLTERGATDYVRVCRGAEFANPERTKIWGQHESFMLQGTTYVMEPYQNRMDLALIDGRWQASGLTCQISNAETRLMTPALLNAARDDARGNADRN